MPTNVETMEPRNSAVQAAPFEPSRSQRIQIKTPDLGYSGTSGRDTRAESSSTTNRHLLGGLEGHPGIPRYQDSPYPDLQGRSRDGYTRDPSQRTSPLSQPQSGRRAYGTDCNTGHMRLNINERLQPTIDRAEAERKNMLTEAQVATAILGGLATVVASYLARARGSGQPEQSEMRVKELDQFLLRINAFELDHREDRGGPENDLDLSRWQN
ncbi:hypothetical protein PAXINDRAFT_8178 [Paxillus involutus ATCC 200175]|nr:hypothetical protein PAXINDRAFT_8178 [Paxillus involutus ATCC 200175]